MRHELGTEFLTKETYRASGVKIEFCEVSERMRRNKGQKAYGTSYIGSSSRSSYNRKQIDQSGTQGDREAGQTMIARNPLAPPPLSCAIRHMSSSAPEVNLISTPMLAK